ncbi:PREDICTED: LEAF RUST 10 DISEASE-RESISTANCE LOCUS RECEPTOR-LIKE PROTEIN KINASE-like 1.5 [Camelina sativa]|uniref:LEAF RUST 10 DISEASE-RESISTANCE LOCUS RECEPTOR-LIKE PROTEIN KINASE-like 1.5 n=1 Tax=Camelina sativa TaxID=90675 RepID=A0ABM0Z8V1_CAMSA|nr:PREDICTED: LEAF RUST 10 DISEASE-RESISTANCE LOCUS RECEPTOR-LIKE PROTEIN KINASE-like 1.5 [Camelina sativa]
MSQPPSSSSSRRCFSLLIFVLTIVNPSSASTSSCTSSIHCPPFNSSPPYPFSTSPGCGHPNFQIQCSSPRATITIKNLTFSILHYSSLSSSLTLSPITNSNRTSNCSSLRFSSSPNRFIDLTGSPFRVSDSSCSRLSLLRPCSPLTLPNCSRCPWDCKLLKNPGRILHGCESTHGSLSEQGCQGDLLGFLQDFFTRFGFEAEWDESQDPYFAKCRGCQIKNGVCGFNSTHPNQEFLCFPKNKSRSELVTKRVNHIAVLSLIFALTCLLLAFSVAVAIFRSRRASFLSSVNEEDPAALFLRRHRSAALLPPVFTFEELETATNKFDPKRKIGDGGFGSVYLGQLSDGQLLAVKFLHHHHGATAAATEHCKAFSMKSFCNEILILSSINHPNLVKLHGYCSDPRGLLLVHDYVTNGTLADHLHGRRSKMTWRVRLDIALQTALAMEYLHFAIVPSVVHRDITSSNIFVEKDMKIKVGDFGLSRLLVFSETTVNSASSSDYVSTGPQGTPGYLDPDYHRSFRLTEKSDVYSYGVVLMELITGMKAVDQRREKRDMALADLVVSKIQMGLLDQVIDPLLALDGDDVAAVTDGFGVAAVAELAFRCVVADKDDRPDAKEIVEELRRIRSHTRVTEDDDVGED